MVVLSGKWLVLSHQSSMIEAQYSYFLILSLSLYCCIELNRLTPKNAESVEALSLQRTTCHLCLAPDVEESSNCPYESLGIDAIPPMKSCISLWSQGSALLVAAYMELGTFREMFGSSSACFPRLLHWADTWAVAKGYRRHCCPMCDRPQTHTSPWPRGWRPWSRRITCSYISREFPSSLVMWLWWRREPLQNT